MLDATSATSAPANNYSRTHFFNHSPAISSFCGAGISLATVQPRRQQHN
jgi:hypothetical protein